MRACRRPWTPCSGARGGATMLGRGRTQAKRGRALLLAFPRPINPLLLPLLLLLLLLLPGAHSSRRARAPCLSCALSWIHLKWRAGGTKPHRARYDTTRRVGTMPNATIAHQDPCRPRYSGWPATSERGCPHQIHMTTSPELLWLHQISMASSPDVLWLLDMIFGKPAKRRCARRLALHR